MKVYNKMWLWALLSLCELIQHTTAKQDKKLLCSICRATVEEATAKVQSVDPNKKVKVGSFRLDSAGNPSRVEKMYAKSDIHLNDVFETLCETMSDYALTQSPQGGLGVVRVKDRVTGAELDTSNVGYNDNLKMTFKSYCESIVDDHEDDMYRLFRQDDLDTVEEELCLEITKYCGEEELTKPTMKLKEKRERKLSSFHKLEPKEGEEIIAEEDEDLDMVDSFKKKIEAAKAAAAAAGKSNDEL